MSHGKPVETSFADLQPFFRPRGIALIGASAHPHKLGYGVMRNLIHPEWGFPGPVYPINPKASEILGRRAYAHISEVPDPVDLALILIPAPAVPQAVEDCGRRGVKGIVVLSGGFRELGEEGERLQEEVVRIARRYGMRVIGPNCIGIMDTTIPLNTTFVRSLPLPGHIAFISQSGALCGTAIDFSRARGWGFSRMYSLGNQADVSETDFLAALAQDEATRVICLYVEEISDGRRFFEVAREVTRHKPVLLLKAGRTGAGREAARSHTGALAGEVAAYRAACEDAGVQWCETLQEMFEAAVALAHNPPLRGPRIGVVTNAGGPATLAADVLAEQELEVAHLTAETRNALRQFLPPAAQTTSVVDMLGAAGPREYEMTLRRVRTDPQVDGLLVIHVTQATVDPLELVGVLTTLKAETPDVPMIFTLPGQASVQEALFRAHRAGLPTVSYPEDGVRALRHLWYRRRILNRPLSTPQRPRDLPAPSRLSFPRGDVLTDWDIRPILEAYGIPVVPALLAHTPEEAVDYAQRLGVPVVLKVITPYVLHKTEVGGVAIGLRTPEEVLRVAKELWEQHLSNVTTSATTGLEVQKMIQGYEIIAGILRDPKFGPMVMVGTGGIFAEFLHDVAFSLAPLDSQGARRLIGRTRVPHLLGGIRGGPEGDLDALVEALVRLSWLAVEWPELQELDVNPLFVLPRGQGVMAVDARALLKPKG